MAIFENVLTVLRLPQLLSSKIDLSLLALFCNTLYKVIWSKKFRTSNCISQKKGVSTEHTTFLRPKIWVYKRNNSQKCWLRYKLFNWQPFLFIILKLNQQFLPAATRRGAVTREEVVNAGVPERAIVTDTVLRLELTKTPVKSMVWSDGKYNDMSDSVLV